MVEPGDPPRRPTSDAGHRGLAITLGAPFAEIDVTGTRVGAGSAANLIAPVGSMLGDAIMNMLDCREQEQAATATEEAVRGGNVGDSASWQSETRPNVTGTSTVTGTDASGGDQCLIVTDVVIVDGEETTAPKRMCRRPPNNRYVRV